MRCVTGLRTWMWIGCLLWIVRAGAEMPAPDAQSVLWFDQPARAWTEALPVGNGRLGAMVFGGISEDRIQFNEDTLWKGAPHDYDRPGAHDHLAEIRQMLFQGEIKQADELTRKFFLSNPVRQKAYQPFGDLHLSFPGMTNIRDYRRSLDLETATETVRFTDNGVVYQREVYASHPDQVLVVKITANQPNRIQFHLRMDSPHPGSHTARAGAATLVMTGQVEEGGLRFESRAMVRVDGGQVQAEGDGLSVTGANSATIYLVAATSFKNYQDITGDPDQRCADALAALGEKKEEQVRQSQQADYKGLYERVRLNLGSNAQVNEPLDRRLLDVKKTGLAQDPALAALDFNYGRYLLISCSRPGGQPANLQGLWNEDLNPPWESKWTLNINCEMNYWPAEVCNLSQCAQPLFDMIHDLSQGGVRTAREQYGSRGWVVHHNTDLWRGTAPINNIDGVWPTGGAWLCYHLWEHYLFTGDKAFLARVLPEMEGASIFFVDDLVKDPQTGWKVTSPSFSPEEGNLCYGPTMDNQLIRALLNGTIEAERILGVHEDLMRQFKQTAGELAPNQVGKYGQLQEWLQDVDVPNNNHRHMSPLWALFPGADISPADPRIWQAAQRLLQWRGAGSTGWSYAWRIPLWARVGDASYAFSQLEGLLSRRTLPNLFDLCGPFQIDGNLGATAGVAEMLLQSPWTQSAENHQARILTLLPALPEAWPRGSVTGLCARDGFVVDMAWDKGKLTRVRLHSKLGRPFHIVCGKNSFDGQGKAGDIFEFDGSLQKKGQGQTTQTGES